MDTLIGVANVYGALEKKQKQQEVDYDGGVMLPTIKGLSVYLSFCLSLFMLLQCVYVCIVREHACMTAPHTYSSVVVIISLPLKLWDH